MLGVIAALVAGIEVAPRDVALVVIGSLLAHAAVNLLNEHHDYGSGLDGATRPTPFSGGSGALPACPGAAPWVRLAGRACIGATVAIGAYFLHRQGPEMLWFGGAGLVLVVFYTGWIVRHPLICLLAPGLGFGPVMVLGSHWAVGGELNHLALAVTPMPLLLVSALLLVNQLPDIEADRRAGRRHLAIVLGPVKAARLAAVLNLSAYLALGSVLALGWLPATTWPVLLLLVPVAGLAIGLLRLRCGDFGSDRTRLLPVMTAQVAVVLASLLLLDLSLWWGA